MRTEIRDAEFSEYAAGARESLRQFAYVISGDWHLAEDLVQIALSKLYVAWPRVDGNPTPYVRRILVNCHRDHMRKPWWRRERHDLDAVSEPAYHDSSEWESQSDVVAALQSLPTSMRHILALRYFADLSVRDTAQVLGCSEGNVKSQSARGLAQLENLLGSTINDGSVQS